MGIRMLLIGDCHLGYRPYGLLEREQDIYDVFSWIIELIEKKNYDLIVLLGDVLELEKIKDYRPWGYLSKFLKIAEGRLIYVQGNHDRGLIEVIKPFFFESTKIYDWGFYVKLVNYDLIGIHYTTDLDIIKEIRSIQLDWNRVILFVHQDIALKGAGYTEFLKGKCWKLEDFKGIKKVFAGHIHDFLEEENVVVVGAIETFSISEKQNKVVLEVDLTTDDLEYRKITLPTRPVFHVSNRQELLTILEKVKRKPIIYYYGDDLQASDYLIIEDRALYFRKVTEREQQKKDEIQDVWWGRAGDFNQVRIYDIVIQVLQEYKLADWFIKDVLNYFSTGELKMLEEKIQQIRGGEGR